MASRPPGPRAASTSRSHPNVSSSSRRPTQSRPFGRYNQTLMDLAYLDIETSWDKRITVIGIYREGLGTVQLIAPDISVERLRAALDGVRMILTFNGAGFDLPVIEAALGIRLQ